MMTAFFTTRHRLTAPWQTFLAATFRTALCTVLAIRLVSASAISAEPEPDLNSCPSAGDAGVVSVLKPIRARHDVPAIVAVTVTGQGIVCRGVVGFRKRGTDIAATLTDHWHLGSETKAMTATLTAVLVERGVLSWDTSLAEIFPELASTFHPDFRAVTMRHLLSHHAGLTKDLDLSKFRGEDARQERSRAVAVLLAEPPLHPPGTKALYSNLGYIIAGAALEKVTGKSWESLMREEVFEPLGMEHAGFGGVGTPGKIDQPWGHGSGGTPVGGNGPGVDNPPVMGPAGRVHCPVEDWARFVMDQLNGARGEKALLPPASYGVLHTPPYEGGHALGWMVTKREWGGGTVLTHTGDNTMNFANVWIAPQRDFAVLVCINQGGHTAFQASDEAVWALIQAHLARKP